MHLQPVLRRQVLCRQRRPKTLPHRPTVLLPHPPQHLPPKLLLMRAIRRPSRVAMLQPRSAFLAIALPQPLLLPEALLGDISVEDKRGHYHRGTTGGGGDGGDPCVYHRLLLMARRRELFAIHSLRAHGKLSGAWGAQERLRRFAVGALAEEAEGNVYEKGIAGSA